MRRSAATLVLLVIGCNAGDRDEGPLSGSAGLSAGASAEGSGDGSAGEPSGSEDASGADEDADGADEASGSSGGDSASTTDNDTTTGSDTSAAPTGSSTGELVTDGGSESSGDLADGVLDIVITAHNDCTFTTEPASITVPEGTEFTVNWVSSAASEVEFDVAKIDAFNAVPIILGMEPGTSYHDDIREWCGTLFTGTFDFRVTSCFEHHYIPVDCGG